MIVDYQLLPYMGALFLVVAAVIAVWKKYSALKTLAVLLFAAYLAALLAIEFLPLSFGPTEMLSQDLGFYPLPFTLLAELPAESSSSGLLSGWFELVKMICLLIPFGLLLPAIFSSRINHKTYVTIFAAVTLGIELIQLLEDGIMGAFSKRVSFDEVLLAFVGCLMGYLLWYLMTCLLDGKGRSGIEA